MKLNKETIQSVLTAAQTGTWCTKTTCKVCQYQKTKLCGLIKSMETPEIINQRKVSAKKLIKEYLFS